MSELQLRAVLDSTAIVAYCRGAESVGEVLSEITDEGAGFAVPHLCLVEAAIRLDADAWPLLELLLSHSQCERLEWPTTWRDVAAAARSLGSTDRAVAMLAAVDLRAYLLTAEPESYGRDAVLVIGI